MRTRLCWLTLVIVAGAGWSKELSGVVVDSEGHPVAGARVTWTAGDAVVNQTETAADGTFTIAFDDAAAAGYGICLIAADGYGVSGRSSYELETDHRIVLEPPASLSLEVLHPDGQPLAGLPVRIGFLSRQPSADRPRLLLSVPATAAGPELRAVTDEDGRVSFTSLPAGAQVRVDVDDERFAQNDEWWLAGQAEARLKLERAGTIRGRVTFETGEPVGGAIVGYKDAGRRTTRAVADADGRYELRRLTPGVGVLIADPPPAAVADWTSAAEPVVELPEFNPEATVNLVLRHGVPLTVTVVEEGTGTPAKDIYVRVNGPQRPPEAPWPSAPQNQLDEQGRITVRVLPGEQTIQYGNLTADRPYETQAYPLPTVTVAEGQPQAFELKVKPRRTFPAYQGRVVDEAGQPVEGAAIELTEQGGGTPYLREPILTDADGRFEVENHGSTSAMVFAHKGTAGTATTTTVQPGTEPTLTLHPDAQGAITAMVMGPDGLPLPGAKVQLLLWTDRYGLGGASATTDETGTAVLPCWPHDSYSLTLECAGYGQANSERFAVKPGEKVTQGPFELAKADAFVAGWVVDENGQPVAGISVILNGSPNGYRRTVTNAQGEFRFEEVVDAPVRVMAHSSDGRIQGSATLKANDENAVVKVKQVK